MRHKKTRSSIERRFVLSILWVGVIPMFLALLIGYFAAREAQQISIMQNLLTAARKTAGAVRLVIQERERLSVRIAQSPEIVQFLKSDESARTHLFEKVMGHLTYESQASQDLKSQYFLYDASRNLLINISNTPPPKLPGLEISDGPRFVGLDFSEELNIYSAHIVTPIYDPLTSTILGYLSEQQNVNDLLTLILEEQRQPSNQHPNRYEVVLFSDDLKFTVNLDPNETTAIPPPPRISPVHPALAKKLEHRGSKQEDAFLLFSYTTNGQNLPVLMAYRKISEDFPIYVVVHQPTIVVFSTINVAAIVTLFVTFGVIGIFCIIAYRIINNSVIRPVSLLNEGAQIIRQGNLDLKLKINTGDEIEELATSFNQMAAALRSNIRHLRTSEEKYRHLITSMRDGVFQTDAQDRIVFINTSGATIMGYDNFEDLLGKHLGSVFLEPSEYESISEAVANSPFIENVRVWLKRPDGEQACVEFSGSRIYDEKGNFLGVEGSFRDVTRNVRLEREVAERADRIAYINQIANVINTSVEAGLVYENLIKEIHHLAEFDYAAISVHLNDGNFETRQLWPELSEGRELFPRMDDENSCAGWVCQHGESLIIEDLLETKDFYRHQFPSTIRSVLCVPLRTERGSIGALSLGSNKTDGFTKYHAQLFEQIAPHLAAAIRNAQLLEDLKKTLDEVNLAKQKLHEANEELKSLDEIKTHLLSNVSHELRTPLVAVMGYTDMLLNERAGPINQTQQEYLEIMMRNIEKLVTLIENLLDFSKLYQGSEELLFTRLDIVDCILTSMQTVRPIAESRNIQLDLRIHDSRNHPVESPILIEGDKGKLGQVFNNLLSNAVKFNHNGGLVTVDVEVRKEDVVLSVIDTGIGIPPEAHDKIFTRFYQYDASSTRKYGGTGIGLSIAQDIVRLHGSRITVSSTPGQGSTFRFSLPLYLPPRTHPEQSRHVPLPIETHQLIELVSQDRALSSQIRQALLSEGMDIIHAAYPAAAVTLAQKYNPECIIVDSESGPSGTLLLEELFQEPLPTSIPIILLTDDDRLYNAFSKRVTVRVKRNFRKSTLLSGIHYALSERRLPSAKLGSKILCVDDDEEIGIFIKRCLMDEGYHVDYCQTGEEALELVSRSEYWLVLLDIAMPGIDGWEVCSQIKHDKRLADVKVYIITAKAIGQNSAEMRESGADGFLLKPFRAEDIIDVVRAFDSTRYHAEVR